MRATPRRVDIHTQGLHMLTRTQDLHLQGIQVTTLLPLSSTRDLSQSVWMKAPQVVEVLRLLHERLILVQRCIRQVVVLHDLDLLQATQSHLTRDIHLHIPQEATRISLTTTLQRLLRFNTPHLTQEIINFAKGGEQCTQSP